jgi:hypothetical protein
MIFVVAFKAVLRYSYLFSHRYALKPCSIAAKHTTFLIFFCLFAAVIITFTCLRAMMGTNNTDIYGQNVCIKHTTDSVQSQGMWKHRECGRYVGEGAYSSLASPYISASTHEKKKFL